MSSIYDLHTHSTASDGTLSPAELVRHAGDLGVQVLSITDHDTTDGVHEAEQEAAAVGIALIPGVEISTSWGNSGVHILGLGIDPECHQLQQGLAGLRETREQRAQEMGRRLEKNGISGAYAGARTFADGSLVGRVHFARYLVETGHAESVRQVFQHYLKMGKPGYVSTQWATIENAVSWIHAAGGQALIAHPARYRFTRSKMIRLLGEFVEIGGDGMEVIAGSYSKDDIANMARYTREFDLLASVGSDYHGPENQWIEVGRLPPLPTGVRAIWQGWSDDITKLSA
jgi:predicted metal-dependent phosphoesterase TrpH